MSETTAAARGSRTPAKSRNPLPSAAPDPPLVVIDASRPPRGLDLREIWAYRELLYFLIWRDLKVRYKQTALGVAWVAMLPLASALIFTVFLGRVAQIGSDGLPYPLFAYAALLPWTFFSTAAASGAGSLAGSAHLITKVYFPRALIPAAAVGARLVDFGIASTVLIAMMLYYRIGPGIGVLMLPVLILLLMLFTVAFVMWSSALNVRYRDVGMVVPVALQLWMFVSPIVYPMSLVPEKWRLLYSLNPLAGIIGNFRAALSGGAFDWTSLAIAAVITLALLAYAAREFGRVERNFADFI